MKAANSTACLILTSLVIFAPSALLVAENPNASSRGINQPVRTLFTIERKKEHLGAGLAISPNGKLLVYVGDDNGLYIQDLEGGQAELLIKEIENGIDVFANPLFSPDGSRVLFNASGGTYYTSSDIYSIKIDGSSIVRLSRAKPLPAEEKAKCGNGVYAQYFYSGQYSPTGAHVMLGLYDSIKGTDSVALIDSSGRNLQIIDEGLPLFWSADVQGFYYSQGNTVKKFDLNSRQSRRVTDFEGKLLGHTPAGDALILDDGTNIRLQGIDGARISSLTVPRCKTASQTVINWPLVRFNGVYRGGYWSSMKAMS
jgi:hypothetical protein